MKKNWIMLLAIAAITIVVFVWNQDVVRYGCTYRGENENWTAEYIEKGKWIFKKDGFLSEKSEGNRRMTVTYKGELTDLTALNGLKISYGVGSMRGVIYEMDGEDIKEEKFVYKREGAVHPGVGTIVEITIEMDDDIQKIELENIKEYMD